MLRDVYNVQEEPVVGGGTPVIQILKLDACYSKSLEDVICKVKKETGAAHRRY